MAEGREIRKDSSCSVCLESFQEPKVLPCCHSFCLKCLERILERAEDKSKIICPQCRTEHQVPRERGANDFLDDYTLSATLDDQHKTRRPPTCQQCCEGREAVTYCLTCSHLCKECLEAHKRLKIFQSHKIMSDQQQEFSVEQNQPSSCAIHPNEQLKLFCKTCQRCACLLCFVGSHNGHDVRSLDSGTRGEIETVINDLITEAASKLTEFEQSLKYVSMVEKDKNEQSLSLKAEIDQQVEALISQIQERQQELHKEVDEAFDADKKELWAQKEYHKTNMISLEGALNFARRCLNCREDTKLFALSAQVTTRLKELSQLKWDPQITEKIEITKIWFEQTKLFCLLEDPTDFKLVGEIHADSYEPSVQLITDGEVDQQGSSASLQIKAVVEFNGKETKREATLTASARYTEIDHSRRLYNSYQQEQSFIRLQKGTNINSWMVIFTPPKKGTCRITFTAQGKYGKKNLYNQYSCTVDAALKHLESPS